MNRYVKVKIQVEDMKSLGEEDEDAGKKGVGAEEQVPAGSPPASVSPDPAGVTRAGRDASILCRHRVTSRSKLGQDAKHSGSVVSVGKHLNRLGHERALHIKGTGTILRGKLETNGNYVNTHPSQNNQETRREDGFKVARKRRPVTVDISKAKTSLEALKLSIKQLKWKEVGSISVFLSFFPTFLQLKMLFNQCFIPLEKWQIHSFSVVGTER